MFLNWHTTVNIDQTYEILCIEVIIVAEKKIILVGPDMTSEKIQSCLKEKGCTIKFREGSYSITNTLYLYSDTDIILDGATLIRKAGCYVFMTYANASTTKYNGQKNITISGGIIIGNGSKKISNLISIVHAQNITIRGLTLKNNVGSHAIEVNSSNNVVIDRCIFDGNIIDRKNPYREAVQIDFAYYGALNYAAGKLSACYDNTHCKSITVQNCLFKGFNVCIGTHTQTKSDEKHTGIYLTGNTAVGIGAVKGYGSCFKLINFEDVLIEGNQISGFARGIEITSSNRFYLANGSTVKKKPPYVTGCKDITIRNNTIQNASADYAAGGIFVTSKFTNLIHYNITVTGNKFRLNSITAKHDINAAYCYGITINSNETELKIVLDKATVKNVKAG
jgi:hypothetical protein